jgi:hypothetical protein
MSVPKPDNPAAARFARWLLGRAVRYWPKENRAWGLALAAEIDETASASETVRWSMGGIMLFTRSVLSSAWAWMKLPLGSSLPAGGPQGPSLLPKRSRLFTATILAATTLLFLLPESREAFRTVRASWLGFILTNSDERKLEEMGARAEKDKDASMLAFVALGTHDPKRGQELVEKSVALDPKLVWIYGAKNHRMDYYPARQDWLDRLHEADPGNAVPLLLAAAALAEPKLSPNYRDEDFAKLGNDPQWMALMERAYAAPHYDSYLQKHFQLMRMAWERDRYLPPVIVFYGMWSHAIPDLRLIRLYGDIEIREAKKAQAEGDEEKAEKLANQVGAFGMRVADSNGPFIEKLVGIAVARNAQLELAELYASEGKTEEARLATSRVTELDHVVKGFTHDDPRRAEQIHTLRREGALVQGFAILGGIAGIAAILGILVVELRSGKSGRRKTIWRRAVSFAADHAPATLFIASGAFVVCFLPFQRALADFRASGFLPADERRITDALWSLIMVPEYMLGTDAAVAFWSMVTVTLSALAVFVLAWGFYRARRRALNPA